MSSDLIISAINPEDYEMVVEYYEHLSDATRMRFAPHAFNKQTFQYLFESTNIHWAYIAKNKVEVVGYVVLRRGVPDHDLPRMNGYGLTCDQTDCLFAPSIADDLQGKGVGKQMFKKVTDDLPNYGIRRVFLWGGVQADNHQAIRYYQKLGFRELGSFEYHGMNYDMVLEL